MKISATSRFSHPVMNSEYDTMDFVLGSFELGVGEIKIDNGKIEIYISNVDIIDELTIPRIIDDGEAQAFIDIECSSTMLRRCEPIKLGEKNPPLEFVEGDLYGKVLIQCFVSASRDIFNYTSLNFNDDYARAGITSFDLNQNDILAFSNSVELTFDPPDKMSQFWSVVENKELKHVQSKLDLNEGIAYIELSSELYKRYMQLISQGKKGEDELIRSIYTPAFIEAIYKVEEFDYDGMNWAIGLKAMIDKKCEEFPELFRKIEEGHRPENPYEMAQALLKDPLSTLINFSESEQD